MYDDDNRYAIDPCDSYRAEIARLTEALEKGVPILEDAATCIEKLENDVVQMQADLILLAEAVIDADYLLDFEGIGWRLADTAAPIARRVKGE